MFGIFFLKTREGGGLVIFSHVQDNSHEILITTIEIDSDITNNDISALREVFK